KPESGMSAAPTDWSLDGQRIVFTLEKARSPADLTKAVRDLWILPGSGDPKPVPYLAEGRWDKLHAAISPNGHFLAYSSNESGQYEVFVRTFPDPAGGLWQVSKKGGRWPRWRRDGNELYYQDGAGNIVAVPVRTDPHFQSGTPATIDINLGTESPASSGYDFV